MSKPVVTKLDRNEFIDVLVALRTLAGGYSINAENATVRGNTEAHDRWAEESKRVMALYTKLADADSMSFARIEG